MDFTAFFQSDEWIHFVAETTKTGNASLIISIISVILSIFTLKTASSTKKEVKNATYRLTIRDSIETLKRNCQVIECSPNSIAQSPVLTTEQKEKINQEKLNHPLSSNDYIMSLYSDSVSSICGTLANLKSKYSDTLGLELKKKIEVQISNLANIKGEELFYNESKRRAILLTVSEIIGSLENQQIK